MGRAAPCRLADDRRVDVGNAGALSTPDARHTTGSACPCPIAFRPPDVSTGGHALVGGASSFWTVAVPYDEHTALLVIDVQNDFADPEGSLYVSGAERRRRRREPRGRRGADAAGAAGRLHAGLASAGHARTSPRTAAPGRSTASPTPGAPTCTPPPSPATTGASRGSAARTATRGSRWCTPPRARPRRPASTTCCASAASTRVVVVGPRHRLLREGDRARRGPAGVRHDGADRGRRARRARAGRRRAGDRRDGRRGRGAGVTSVPGVAPDPQRSPVPSPGLDRRAVLRARHRPLRADDGGGLPGRRPSTTRPPSSCSCGRLPGERRFLVAAGLDDALAGLEAWRFDDGDVAYLAGLGQFPEAFLDHLADLRFTGDVWAVPEGEVVFAGEPLVRVTAPLVEAQLVETWLLNRIASQTMLASKAARVALACGDRSFVDFSARRDHGVDAAMAAARAAWIVGAAGTSLVAAGRRFGIPLSGTMAHSFVMSLRRRARRLPGLRPHVPRTPWCCSSTPTTPSRGPAAPPRWPTSWRPRASPSPGCASTRATSADLSVRARAVLDDAGLPEVTVLASGDLDEHRIAELLAGGAPDRRLRGRDPARHQRRRPDPRRGLQAGRGRRRPEDEAGVGQGRPCPAASRCGGSPTATSCRSHDEDVARRAAAAHPVMAAGRRTVTEDLSDVRARALASLAWLPAPLRSLDPVRAGAAVAGGDVTRPGRPGGPGPRRPRRGARPVSRRERLGVFGGTFDPPHVGHLVTAVNVRHELGLDRVLLVVNDQPWQKLGTRDITPADDRFAMVEAAVGDRSRASRPAGSRSTAAALSFTADTLARPAGRGPERELFVVLGSDAAGGLPTWERADEVRDAGHDRRRRTPGAAESRSAARVVVAAGRGRRGSRCRAPTCGRGSPTDVRSTTCSPPTSSRSCTSVACTGHRWSRDRRSRVRRSDRRVRTASGRPAGRPAAGPGPPPDAGRPMPRPRRPIARARPPRSNPPTGRSTGVSSRGRGSAVAARSCWRGWAPSRSQAPALAVGGLSAVRNSTVGRYQQALGPTEPGYQASVVPTPTMGLLLRSGDGRLAGAAVLALEPGDAGGTVALVPASIVVTDEAGAEHTLDEVYADRGAEAASQALGEVLTVAVDETVEVDEATWAQLVEPVGPVDGAARRTRSATGPPARSSSSRPTSVASSPPGRPTSPIWRRVDRQQAFWDAWLPKVRDAGEAALPGEVETGRGAVRPGGRRGRGCRCRPPGGPRGHGRRRRYRPDPGRLGTVRVGHDPVPDLARAGPPHQGPAAQRHRAIPR